MTHLSLPCGSIAGNSLKFQAFHHTIQKNADSLRNYRHLGLRLNTELKHPAVIPRASLEEQTFHIN